MPGTIAPAAKRPIGRPKGTDTFTQEVADEVCRRLSEGEFLTEICRTEGLPSRGAVYDWRDNHPEFREQLARARKLGNEVLFRECLEIADETGNDTIRTESGERANAEWIARSRLRVETRLKMLAHMEPETYGERKNETTVNVGVAVAVVPESRRSKIMELRRSALAAPTPLPAGAEDVKPNRPDASQE